MNHPDTTTLLSLLKEGMVTGHMPFLLVSSGSMSPLLCAGDEIGVQAIELGQLRIGDVVVVGDPDQILTHRYWGKHFSAAKGNGSCTVFLTRGDRALDYDRPWTEEQLLGRVVVRRRNKQLLWLDYGPGRWLNRTLAALSHGEERYLSRSASRQSPTRQWRNTLPPGSRLLRFVIRAWSGLLTYAVEQFGQRPILDSKS